MSLTFSLHNSIGLSPVSLLSVSFTDIIFLELAISISICVVVGIRIVLGSCL